MSPDKRQSIRAVFAQAVAGRWSEALSESRAMADEFPDDARLRALAEDMALRSGEQASLASAPAAPVAAPPASFPAFAAVPPQDPALAPLHRFPPLVPAGPLASAPTEAPPAPPRTGETALDKAFLEEARRRLERQGSGASMGDVVQDSRRISDVLRAATTRHRGDDAGGLLETARACLAQDLLPEALRLCQSLLERDPNNEQVKELLREISRRRGL